MRYHASIATGDVLVGLVGHPSKLTADLIGTTVNRAGKLLGAAHKSPSACAFCDDTKREAAVEQ